MMMLIALSYEEVSIVSVNQATVETVLRVKVIALHPKFLPIPRVRLQPA